MRFFKIAKVAMGFVRWGEDDEILRKWKEQLLGSVDVSQVKAWLESEKVIWLGDSKAAGIEILNVFQLLTAKPVVYLAFHHTIGPPHHDFFLMDILPEKWTRHAM
uniref:Obg-like ATPase 1 n=1 Tax=Tanacetum cinerariifolium TaxID=118510 RepID=A0A6L2MMQ6_TANCI|nr:Obg-like ATPase 1 [Tanacetum cinerariifolium]